MKKENDYRSMLKKQSPGQEDRGWKFSQCQGNISMKIVLLKLLIINY